eukprot:scaffold4364_cov119-Isochrysis_galbana.AAC.16
MPNFNERAHDVAHHFVQEAVAPNPEDEVVSSHLPELDHAEPAGAIGAGSSGSGRQCRDALAAAGRIGKGGKRVGPPQQASGPRRGVRIPARGTVSRRQVPSLAARAIKQWIRTGRHRESVLVLLAAVVARIEGCRHKGSAVDSHLRWKHLVGGVEELTQVVRGRGACGESTNLHR